MSKKLDSVSYPDPDPEGLFRIRPNPDPFSEHEDSNSSRRGHNITATSFKAIADTTTV
jgi:hypothetical protein